MSKTPEGIVKNTGRSICKELGLYGFPVNQGGIGIGGTPDDAHCICGLFMHIEYKAFMDWRKLKSALKTLPSDRQVKRMEECRQAGGITLVVDKTNVEYLRDILTRIIMRCKSNQYKTAVAEAHASCCGWVWTYKDWDAYKRSITNE